MCISYHAHLKGGQYDLFHSKGIVSWMKLLQWPVCSSLPMKQTVAATFDVRETILALSNMPYRALSSIF